MVQSPLDREKGLKNIERNMKKTMKEMSLVEEAFEEQQEDASLSPRPNDEVTTESILSYTQTLDRVSSRLYRQIRIPFSWRYCAAKSAISEVLKGSLSCFICTTISLYVISMEGFLDR